MDAGLCAHGLLQAWPSHFGLCPGELSTSVYAALHGGIIIYLMADLLLGSGLFPIKTPLQYTSFAHITAGKFLTVHLQGSNNLNRCVQTTLQKMMHAFPPQLIVQPCIFHTFPYREYQGFYSVNPIAKTNSVPLFLFAVLYRLCLFVWLMAIRGGY